MFIRHKTQVNVAAYTPVNIIYFKGFFISLNPQLRNVVNAQERLMLSVISHSLCSDVR